MKQYAHKTLLHKPKCFSWLNGEKYLNYAHINYTQNTQQNFFYTYLAAQIHLIGWSHLPQFCYKPRE